MAFAINFFWKISAHATAVGGLFAVLFYIAAAGLNEYYFMPWLTAGALIAGLTGTARLILGAHTLLQVAAGYALGFSAVLLLMWI